MSTEAGLFHVKQARPYFTNMLASERTTFRGVKRTVCASAQLVQARNNGGFAAQHG